MMKRYAIAVNSVALLASFSVGLYLVYMVTQRQHLTERVDPTQRVVILGTIVNVEKDIVTLEYAFAENEWQAEIILTVDTTFHFSQPLVRDNGVIYGRKVTAASRADLASGMRVVADWVLQEGVGYIANDIIIVDQNATTLLYEYRTSKSYAHH